MYLGTYLSCTSSIWNTLTKWLIEFCSSLDLSNVSQANSFCVESPSSFHFLGDAQKQIWSFRLFRHVLVLNLYVGRPSGLKQKRLY